MNQWALVVRFGRFVSMFLIAREVFGIWLRLEKRRYLEPMRQVKKLPLNLPLALGKESLADCPLVIEGLNEKN